MLRKNIAYLSDQIKDNHIPSDESRGENRTIFGLAAFLEGRNRLGLKESESILR